MPILVIGKTSHYLFQCPILLNEQESHLDHMFLQYQLLHLMVSPQESPLEQTVTTLANTIENVPPISGITTNGIIEGYLSNK